MIIRFINRNSINPNLKINMMIFDVIIKIIFDTILNTYKIGARKFSNIEYTTTRYMAPLNSSGNYNYYINNVKYFNISFNYRASLLSLKNTKI